MLVSEGKEPPCFLQLFQGGLVVHKGSREDGASRTGEYIKVVLAASALSSAASASDPRLSPPAGCRLFCVRGEVEAEASLVEVDCQRSSLRSRASLVLLDAPKGLVYLWHGCKSHANARQVAKRAAERIRERRPSELGLGGSVTVEMVEEGGEPAEFAKALGPEDPKAYDCMLQGTWSRSRPAAEAGVSALNSPTGRHPQIPGSTTTPRGCST